jgi:predicted  nucleic acid-binding Zn-ribbon protein
VKDVVGNLINLQDIDHRLNELKMQKGDLPQLIEVIKEDISTKKEEAEDRKQRKEKLQNDRKLYEKEIEASKALFKKYEDQLYKVKTNKEYDAISLEMDTKKIEVEGLEDKILKTMEEDQELEKELEELTEEIGKLETQFNEYEKELEEISKSTVKEENKLLKERDKVASKIEGRLLRQYERIKNAKEGIAVAPIKKSSCGGCFSAIPPQKIVEIRELNRLFTCEYCGRILVWVDNND